MIIINNISRGRRDFITTNSSLAMIINIININVINNNNARAKLICAVIVINNKGKNENPGKVLVQSIQSTNPDFLPL